MARKSIINRNLKRAQLVARFREQRTKLRLILKNLDASVEDKMNAQRKLQELPRDSCPVRLRNRCAITGRSRGFFRRFGLSRNMVRDLAMNGEIPGITKSSW